MAKKSVYHRNLKRQRTVLRYAVQRRELKELIRSPNVGDDEREQAMLKLQRLPRNASPVRLRNRCSFHGRGKGVYRRFGLCRNRLREAAMGGEIPGLVKSSW